MEKSLFSKLLLGNLDSSLKINEARTHPHAMHTNKLKMAERPIYDKTPSNSWKRT